MDFKKLKSSIFSLALMSCKAPFSYRYSNTNDEMKSNWLHSPLSRFFSHLCYSNFFFINREKDIENFLESSRSKFIGYTLGRWVLILFSRFRVYLNGMFKPRCAANKWRNLLCKSDFSQALFQITKNTRTNTGARTLISDAAVELEEKLSWSSRQLV